MQELQSERKSHPALLLLGAVPILCILFFIFMPASRKPPVESTSSSVTMNNYNRIQTGMTYFEVCRILETEGTETARGEMAGHLTVVFSWQGDGVANMNAMFQNGKLVSKAQFGLK